MADDRAAPPSREQIVPHQERLHQKQQAPTSGLPLFASEASLQALEDESWEEWDGRGSFVHHCIAGAAAGVGEHVLMFPLDTYKVRGLLVHIA